MISAELNVILKSLGKRDPTTKLKALDDLLGRLDMNDIGTDEEALISVWVVMYPILSLDVERRIRAGCHNVLGQMVLKHGKKLAKHMKVNIAGSWLIGCHDMDRLVARAANESFSSALSSPEKRSSFWQVYQSSIYARCIDLAFVQTADTISDRRFVNEEDAEAKYCNAVCSSLATLSQLISLGAAGEISKISFDDILANKQLWNLLASHKSLLIRYSLRLLDLIIRQKPATLREYAASLRDVLMKQLVSLDTSIAADLMTLLHTVAKCECCSVGCNS